MITAEFDVIENTFNCPLCNDFIIDEDDYFRVAGGFFIVRCSNCRKTVIVYREQFNRAYYNKKNKKKKE